MNRKDRADPSRDAAEQILTIRPKPATAPLCYLGRHTHKYKLGKLKKRLARQVFAVESFSTLNNPGTLCSNLLETAITLQLAKESRLAGSSQLNGDPIVATGEKRASHAPSVLFLCV